MESIILILNILYINKLTIIKSITNIIKNNFLINYSFWLIHIIFIYLIFLITFIIFNHI